MRPITKSDFLAGLQCPLRLWSRYHAPIPYEERSETPAMRVGTDIGLLAHRLFPGGVLVKAEPWECEKSAAQTNALIADQDIPAIFEAGFLCDGLHARADVLKRKPSRTFALYEVKSTGSVKQHHIPDLAFQVHVARKSGLEIDEAGIIHINTGYERGAELDVFALFTPSDETARVRDYLRGIDERIDQAKAILAGTAPHQEPGSHCHDPHTCEFWERCTIGKPEDWIFYLPRLAEQRYEELHSRGIESIREIPDDFDLKELQARVRDALRTGKPYIGPGLAEALAEVAPPLSYLDFETVNPAVPIWPGTYPFQRIPFQWSLHKQTETGALTHAEFLADGSADPRRAVAETLAEQLGHSDERIVVYNLAFEGSVLRDLADQFPDLATTLLAVRDRLWDLLPVVRKHVYLSGFGGSFSIKAVAGALAPDIAYSELNGIADGMAASDAFLEMVANSKDNSEESVRTSLLAYCHLDTLAMVKAHHELAFLARKNSSM